MDATARRWLGCGTEPDGLGPVTRFIPVAAWGEAVRHARAFRDPLDAGRLIPDLIETIVHRADGTERSFWIQVIALSPDPQTASAACFVVRLQDPAFRLAPVESLSATMATQAPSWLQDLPLAAWVTEGERIVQANDRCAELLGQAADALQSRAVTHLVRADVRPALQQHLAHAQAGAPALPPLRVVLDRPDGSAREVELMFSAVRPSHGRPQVLVVVIDLTQRRHERAEIEQSQLELRQLSASLVEAREAERRRIARELHDELGQQLSALKMELSTLRGTQDAAVRAHRIDGMLQMIDETVGSVRRIAADLRPLMLDDLGLSAALDWLAREFARRMGIQVRLELDDNAPPVPERAAIAVYRMVQEALTNIARHAKATRARIELRQADGELLLTVDDDGVGLPPMAMHRAGSHGLVGMRERCHMLGGELQIGASPLGGSRIAVRLPLQSATKSLLERRRSDRSSGSASPQAGSPAARQAVRSPRS